MLMAGETAKSKRENGSVLGVLNWKATPPPPQSKKHQVGVKKQKGSTKVKIGMGDVVRDKWQEAKTRMS